ncbi:MAG: type IV toxin-antitoxin system AbiEi family antitoxin domain-containing protein [Candidatus Uhrbacteria bacterium]|nr:type IV toxin-antitoxin system AbiEi family antitoxin domain-containing protein [Candidatus Uhrbacteria bacterium]
MEKKLKKGDYLDIILRSPQTVFTTEDVCLLWGETNRKIITARLNKYEKIGKLVRAHRGIYAKDSQYDRFELATRIYTPSYISFETVLTRAGINFQYYETIFVASYVSRTLKINGQNIEFVRMKDYVLCNTTGIESAGGYSIATKERAFLDRIYISKDYHFDHLDVLDWGKVFGIIPIYRNKRMEGKVKEYFEYYKSTEK